MHNSDSSLLSNLRCPTDVLPLLLKFFTQKTVNSAQLMQYLLTWHSGYMLFRFGVIIRFL